MLDKHLIVETRPKALKENIVLWDNYRITVLQDRLFRLECSEKKQFRDDATQSVWFRDMPQQIFQVEKKHDECIISTNKCKIVLKSAHEDCYVELDGKRRKLNNAGNLLGTARTLDGCDGDTFVGWTNDRKKDKSKADRIKLDIGVCSRLGVAVFDDVNSLTLGLDGIIQPVRGNGVDEYIFAYGNDYRSAVKALYLITGNTPLIPRFALGNWWSRYYIYTDKEYLRLLNSFEEQNIPLTVATIDMDWHYSKQMEEDLHITEKGRNTPFYGGDNGWTGYTWNQRLFPDYKKFLQVIQDKDLKITLNLHPADGIRWWEYCYEDMATALGRDATSGEWIKFDIANTDFINAYFSVVHKPYEKEGVAFWWIDWQQGVDSGMDGLDPLWSLNHYHYLDNAKDNPTPLILSRFSGVGSHRYPIGFSGDTIITWDTLDYLPYFTATASNIGYTWWSHDIGGHMFGDKDNEQYLRHIQYGVFSPINRLHCCNAEGCTKEPWAYGSVGEMAKQWLRLRHRLVPYLYTASYKTHKDGVALVEPLYYEWEDKNAYKYKNEYLFGGQLLVVPVTKKCRNDGFARIKAWLPQGTWTDIFTGTQYEIDGAGKELTLLRGVESMPVLIKAGGVLPLSMDEGNSVRNPQKIEILTYSGNGEFILYEDGSVERQQGETFIKFVNERTEKNGVSKQSLTISASGNTEVIPKERKFVIKFKDIYDGKITLYKNGKLIEAKELLTNCVALEIPFDGNSTYRIEVEYVSRTKMQKIVEYAQKTLLKAEGGTVEKDWFWRRISLVNSEAEYLTEVENSTLISRTVKDCLKEII